LQDGVAFDLNDGPEDLDRVSGDDTLELATNTASFALPANAMHLAKIDLEIE